MNDKGKISVVNNGQADLELAFDVGHSSIGWAVFQAAAQTPLRGGNSCDVKILGCGVVTFTADDCLARKRRDYRRQRRHARSTRQRIERMEKLLAGLNILSKEQLAAKHKQAGGHPAPWLLAARVLAAKTEEEKKKALLSWPQLWDVLRWYGHNRGYDRNARWANVSEEALSAAEREEKKGDTEKEKNAVELMEKYNTETMAQTVFADLFSEFKISDPARVETLPFFQKRFKTNQCAFPRSTVASEVLRLLESHSLILRDWDARLIHLLLAKKLSEEDRILLDSFGIRLPKRFEGGLLFGQLVPRFENRIIANCPISGQKVPNKHCVEFLEFRWAMTLANIRIGFGEEKYNGEESLRSLSPEERRKVDARVRRLGFLKIEGDRPAKDGLVRAGKNELREIVFEETKCHRHNLDALLLHPDAKEGLKLLAVKGDIAAFRVAWGGFDDPRYDQRGLYRDDPLRYRFTAQLLRGKKLTVRGVLEQLARLGKAEVAARLREAAEGAVRGKKTKLDPERLSALLDAEFHCDKLKGRARYSRKLLREAVQQVFHKISPLHPLEKGGCLEQTEEVRRAVLNKPLDQQTNNHLVRHRLLILKRLHEHIIQDFAANDKASVARITVEVARDLQTMSGMTNKDKAKELGSKIKHHHDIAGWLADRLKDERDEKGRPFIISPGLIRKARIADDLDWECPYTGRVFEPAHLVHRVFDKDHVIPRSKRLSDALEALVITSREVNGEKKNRTALQFIKEMSRPENAAKRQQLGIRTEAQFRAFVEKLKTRGSHLDDVRRRKRRKELLLTETWEEKEFTPGDLTKTRHITKLAAQQLEATFKELPESRRPPVISITGAVTAAFRDRTWKLLPLLGAANDEINRLHAEKLKANAEGRDFNLKDAIRSVTHLHHALDAISLGLITRFLVPPGDAGRAGLNGELARLIYKGKLNAEERKRFEALRFQLGLPKFYRWAGDRCNEACEAAIGEGGMLCIDDLPEDLKQQIRAQLAEKRVVQHIPADMSGLKVEENTRGVVKVRGIVKTEDGRVPLRQFKRDEKTGKLSANKTTEAIEKVIGLRPSKGGKGKLREVSGVRIISDNFGVAFLDCNLDAATRFVVVPHHKVWHRIEELRSKNHGKRPLIIRKGDIIEFQKDESLVRFRIFGAGQRARGLYFDAAPLDALERAVELYPSTLLRKQFRLVRTSLTGNELKAPPTKTQPRLECSASDAAKIGI